MGGEVSGGLPAVGTRARTGLAAVAREQGSRASGGRRGQARWRGARARAALSPENGGARRDDWAYPENKALFC